MILQECQQLTSRKAGRSGGASIDLQANGERRRVVPLLFTKPFLALIVKPQNIEYLSRDGIFFANDNFAI